MGFFSSPHDRATAPKRDKPSGIAASALGKTKESRKDFQARKDAIALAKWEAKQDAKEAAKLAKKGKQ